MADGYQTLDGFLKKPFNQEIVDERPDEFESKYQMFKRNNKIKV